MYKGVQRSGGGFAEGNRHRLKCEAAGAFGPPRRLVPSVYEWVKSWNEFGAHLSTCKLRCRAASHGGSAN